MRMRTLVGVAALAVLAGCTSVDLKVSIEDRSTPLEESAAPVESASTVPVPAESTLQPRHLAAEPKATASGKTHTVVAGDTIYNISVRYGVNPRELMALNGIIDPTTLSLGRELEIPVARTEALTATEGTTIESGAVEVAKRPETPDEAAAREVAQAEQRKAAAARGEIEIRWPLQGPVIADFEQTGNLGIDIAAKKGEAVVAVLDGTVQYVGKNAEGYGLFVIVRHNIRLPGKSASHLVTVYGNADKVLVNVNETVRAGQKIAEAGDSDSDRVKLRFEIRQGTPIDPMLYLQKRD